VATETKPDTNTFARWVVGILLIGHGLIHMLGPFEIWGIFDIEELTGQPSFDITQAAADFLGTAWLVAFAVLLVAGIGVLAHRSWWRMWAVAGVVVSQAVIVMWWADAATGTIPNVLVVAAVVFAKRLGLRSRGP